MSSGTTNIATTSSTLTPTNSDAAYSFSNCLICHQTFNITNRAPLVIPCGDTVCRECIQNSIQDGALKCVDCGDTPAVKDLEGLPVNISLIRNLETMKLIATDNVIMPPKAEPEPFINELVKEKLLAASVATKLMRFIESFDDETQALDEGVQVLRMTRAAIVEYERYLARQNAEDDYYEDLADRVVPRLETYVEAEQAFQATLNAGNSDIDWENYSNHTWYDSDDGEDHAPAEWADAEWSRDHAEWSEETDVELPADIETKKTPQSKRI